MKFYRKLYNISSNWLCSFVSFHKMPNVGIQTGTMRNIHMKLNLQNQLQGYSRVGRCIRCILGDTRQNRDNQGSSSDLLQRILTEKFNIFRLSTGLRLDKRGKKGNSFTRFTHNLYKLFLICTSVIKIRTPLLWLVEKNKKKNK